MRKWLVTLLVVIGAALVGCDDNANCAAITQTTATTGSADGKHIVLWHDGAKIGAVTPQEFMDCYNRGGN